jgi:hypothetical protein
MSVSQSISRPFSESFSRRIDAVPGGFSPADLNPFLWFRPGVGITVTGSGVSAWANQGSDSNNLVQGTDANRPPAGTDNQGRQCPAFPAAAHTDVLRIAAMDQTYAQPVLHSFVCRTTSVTASRTLLDGPGGSNRNLCRVNSATLWECWAGTAFLQTATAAIGWNILSFLIDGASSKIFVNGVEAASGVDVGALGIDVATLGNNDALASDWFGEIAEFHSSQGAAATAANALKLYSYFSSDHGL